MVLFIDFDELINYKWW